MMTRKWMSNNGDFTKLHSRIDILEGHCTLMRPVPAQVRRRRRRRGRVIRRTADFNKLMRQQMIQYDE